MKNAVIVLGAFLLDLLAGDPPWLPHPVRFFGRVIAAYERLVRRLAREPLALLASGILLAVLLPAGTYIVTARGLEMLYRWHHATGFLVELYLVATTIAVRGLGEAAGAVGQALAVRDLPLARKKVAALVGRDTAQLDARGVARAAVESVAENTVDAAVAPLFYAFLGGAPLALVYRAVNTLDSMIGYRYGYYRYLGWANARLDDLLNFLPARLAGLLFVLAAFLLRGDWRRVWRVMRRDGRKHPSPNSGIPEAAIAGFLGVQLGGPSTYRGVPSFRPFLGEPLVPLGLEHIAGAVGLLYMVAVLAVILGFGLRMIFGYWAG
jgi:adenosylcobinamide-phosphate synthase